MSGAKDNIIYLNVTITDKFISEIGNPVIPKESIRKISTEFAYISKHPFIQVSLGLILTIVGLLPLWHFYVFSKFGGTFYFIEAMGVVFSVIGLWLVHSSFRKGYLMLIDTNFGKKRVVFSGKIEKKKLNDFLIEGRNFGYDILLDIN